MAELWECPTIGGRQVSPIGIGVSLIFFNRRVDLADKSNHQGADRGSKDGLWTIYHGRDTVNYRQAFKTCNKAGLAFQYIA